MFNKFKYIFIISYVLVACSLLASFVSKAEAEVMNAGSLAIDYPGAPGPLFTASNVAPGYSEAKSLTITNTGKVPHSFSIAVSSDLGPLANVMVIEPKVLNTVVWTKTIAQIAKNPESNIIIGSIAPSGSASVQIRAYLPTTVGNEFQGTSTLSFSFVMGNESTDQAEPSADAGTIDSGGVSTVAAGNLARVFNRIANAIQAAPSDTPADTTAGEIKGAATNNNDTEGQAEGEETNSKTTCYWWWVLSIILVIFLAIYGYIVRKIEIVFSWVWPIFAGAVVYLVHWIMHDYFTPSNMCQYFILIDLAILIIYYALMGRLSSAREE